MICLSCFPVSIIFTPPLQMSDIDPLDPLICKDFPSARSFFYLIITWPYNRYISIFIIPLFSFPISTREALVLGNHKPRLKRLLGTKHKLFNTYFPGSFCPCIACCTNSCMFRRHYQGSVLHFDKDLRNKN